MHLQKYLTLRSVNLFLKYMYEINIIIIIIIIGPGYDYMDHSRFSKYNPLAGQLDGMNFWRNVIQKVRVKQNVCSLMAETVDVIQPWHPETTRSRACTF